jgi:hypothetical protein
MTTGTNPNKQNEPPVVEKANNPSISPSKQPQQQSTKPRPPSLMRSIKVPLYGLDADLKEQSLQNARKERARAKTAANVRRALYGNLFICVSKLGAWLSSGSSSMMSEFVYVNVCILLHTRALYMFSPQQLNDPFVFFFHHDLYSKDTLSLIVVTKLSC